MINRKTRVGRVIGDKMDKTVVVAVSWSRPHPLYQKRVRRISKYKVHDENNTYKVGDQLLIIESRPLSKTKRWRVKEMLSRREIAEVQPGEIAVPEEAIKLEVPEEASPPEDVVEEEAPDEAEEPEAVVEAEKASPPEDVVEEEAPDEAEEPEAVVEAEKASGEEEATK